MSYLFILSLTLTIAVQNQVAANKRNQEPTGMITWNNPTQEVNCESIKITCLEKRVPGETTCFNICLPYWLKSCTPNITLVQVTHSVQCKTTSCAQCTRTAPNNNSEKSSVHPTQSKLEMFVASSSSPPLTASVPMSPASVSPSVECGPMLGMAIGILLSLVAILLIGWICITIVLIRRRYIRAIKKEGAQKESTGLPADNPTYESEAIPFGHTDSDNSSTGPTYEQIECVRGNHDVLNPRRAPRPHPPTTPAGSHDLTADQAYDTLDNSTQEHEYHVLENTRPRNGSASKDQDDSALEDNQEERKNDFKTNHQDNSEEETMKGLSMNEQDKDVTGTQPQSYEVPVRKN